MSLFAINFRLADDAAWRLRALDHAVRKLSPEALLYDETPGFYLVRADVPAHQVRNSLAVAADLKPERDLLLIINLSQPDYAQAGSEVAERLNVIMAAR
jgi:hypothetical protein